MMKMPACTLLYAALLLAACSTTGSSDPKPPDISADLMASPQIIAQPVGLLFVAMDTDFDGLTSRNEATDGLATAFAASDTDQSGDLRAVEFQRFASRYLGSSDVPLVLGSFDRDQNRQVTEIEFLMVGLAIFERLDTDSDDALARSEFVKLIDLSKARAEIMAKMKSEMQREMRRRMGGARRYADGGFSENSM